MAQLTLHPPLAGIVRSRGFQRQAPYSARELVNFWPQYYIDGSETLGIRPPMEAWDTPGTGVNLLCRVNGTNSDTPQRTLVAARSGTLYRWTGSAFTAVGGSGTIPTGRAVFAAAFEQKVYIPAATPLVYDYPSDTLANWTATAGTVPADARILVYWAGGLWAAAVPNTPHIVSGCATGKPLDWNFNAEGEGAAFSTIGDNAGLISDPVCALAPVSGDTMIVSGPDSMQAWRGHPRRGGVADLISSSVGIRGQGAWTQIPDGSIIAVTNKGLVSIQGGQAVSLISADRIPNELIGFDYDYLDPRINCAFDARFNCVHICVRDDTGGEAWYYDLKHGGLFEQKLAAYPIVMLRFDPIGTGRASEVLFGGSGYGGLARFDMDGEESIGEARAVLGPFKLSPIATQRGQIKEAQFVFGGGSNIVDADVAFYCGPTGDSAYAASVDGKCAAKYETTVGSIMDSRGLVRPRVAGAAAVCVIDHSAAADNPECVLEEINLEVVPAGRERGYVLHSVKTGPKAGSFVQPGAAGPVSHWTLDETDGDRSDSIGSRTLSATGTVAADTGIIGGALSMQTSAAENYLKWEGEAFLSLGSDFTVSGWIKPGAANLNTRIIFMAEFSDDNDSFIRIVIAAGGSSDGPSNVQGIVSWVDNESSDTGEAFIQQEYLEPLDDWTHIALKYTAGSPNTAELFINGESVGSDTIESTEITGDGFVIIGGDVGGTFMDTALIDDIKVWTRALTDVEIAAIYNSVA